MNTRSAATDHVEYGPLNAAIIRMSRAHRALATQLMGEVGLRPDQGALLMHLWSVGPQRQTALAEHFGRDSASTTRAVQRLERAGFARRREDPTDRRATLVQPTEAGNALRPRVEEQWRQLEAISAGGLSLVEIDQTLSILSRLGDAALSALSGEPPVSLKDI